MTKLRDGLSSVIWQLGHTLGGVAVWLCRLSERVNPPMGFIKLWVSDESENPLKP